MKALIQTITLGLVITTLSGCWAAREKRALAHLDKYLPRLQKGATLAEVERAFDSKAVHEFTIQQDHRVYVGACMSAADSDVRSHAVLSDGRLEKIVEPPARRTDAAFNYLPWDPQEEAERVLSATGLFGDALVESVRKRYPYLRNSNLAGGEFILGPIMFFGEFRKLPELRRLEALAERFSGFKISPGMSEKEVEDILGKPFRTGKTDNNEDFKVFGHDPVGSKIWAERSPWVAVILRDGRVDRVFSHLFFNKQIYLSDDKTLALK